MLDDKRLIKHTANTEDQLSFQGYIDVRED